MDAETTEGKVVEQQDNMLSKEPFSDYLLLTKRKIHLDNGESWQSPR